MSLKSRLRENHILKHYYRVFNLIKQDPSRIAQILEYHAHPERFILCHSSFSSNFGDATSPLVVQALAKKIPLPLSRTLDLYKRPSYAVVGSVLQFPASKRTHVWGAGFLYKEGVFPIKPAKIYAVRGPLTRQRCLDQGLDCPEVYGDPAIFLFDKFLSQAARKKFKIGLIPHYCDIDHPLIQSFARRDEVKLITVRRHPEVIAKECLECDVIISSSLHGLILADALHIPSRWLGVSDIVMREGFKFQDYFASVKRNEPEPLYIADLTITRAIKEAHLHMKPFDRERLLEVCPFKHPTIRSQNDIMF